MSDLTPALLDATSIRVMEPAIIDRLRLVFPEEFFSIERVPSVMTLGEFDRVARMSPFIGLAWTGLKPDSNSGRLLTGAMEWRLFLLVAASGSSEIRFKGDNYDIGLDAMLDLAVVLLQGVTFDNIGLCTVTGANAVYAEGHGDENTVCAQIDFAIRYAASPRAFEIFNAEDLTAIGITWLATTSNEPPADPGITQTLQPHEEDA